MLIARELSHPGKIYSVQWPADSFRIYYTHFALSQFELALFDEAGIELPAQIARAVPKRQAEFFYGRLCARAALGGAGRSDVQVGTGALREPVWPPGYAGSITHNNSIAAAVVVRQDRFHGVGIDIETISQGSASDALRSTIVSSRELDYLESFQGGMSIDTLLTLVFSAKESFYKGVIGLVQRFLDFDVIELRAIDTVANTLDFEVREFLGAEFVPGHRLQVDFKLLDDAHVMTMFQRRT
jgi:enterobactin synthetase component D